MRPGSNVTEISQESQAASAELKQAEAHVLASTPARARRGLSFWASKGIAAFVDQLFTSGANFGLSIYLARTLPQEAYGAYAVAFAIFLLVATLYQGAFLVPTTILGSSQFQSRMPQFMAALVRLHAKASLYISAAVALLAMVVYWISPDSLVDECLLPLVITTPVVLVMWMVRTLWYVRMSPGQAAIGSALYFALLVVGVALVEWFSVVTPAAGLWVMGGAALIAGTRQLLLLRPDWRHPLPQQEVWQSFWSIGRWEMAIAMAAWLPANLCYPVTASLLGDAQAGVLRALQNFSLPIAQTMSSILRLAQPYVSSKLGTKEEATERSVWLLTGMALAVTSVYLLTVTLVDDFVLNLLYKGKYLEYTWLLPWIVLPAVFSTGTESLALGLRARLQSKRLLYAFLGAGAVYVATGLWAASRYQLSGVAATLVLANLVALLVAAAMYVYGGKKVFPRRSA